MALSKVGGWDAWSAMNGQCISRFSILVKGVRFRAHLRTQFPSRTLGRAPGKQRSRISNWTFHICASQRLEKAHSFIPPPRWTLTPTFRQAGQSWRGGRDSQLAGQAAKLAARAFIAQQVVALTLHELRAPGPLGPRRLSF